MITWPVCIEYFCKVIIYFTFNMSIVYITFILYISALVEPSLTLLLTTCHPKAVGGVCYDTVTNCITDTW